MKNKYFLVAMGCLLLATTAFYMVQEARADTANQSTLVITFLDGSKQTIQLNQPSANIQAMEYKTMKSASNTNTPSMPSYVSAWVGKWSSNFGDITFRYENGKLLGNYSHQNGKLEGTLSNDGLTFTGWWSEEPSRKAPNDAGKVVFVMKSNGTKLEGTYYYGENGSGGSWTATKVN